MALQLNVIKGLLLSGVVALGFGMAGCSDGEPVAKGAPPTMRRLSNEQYRNVISDIFGPQITVAGQGDNLARADGMIAIGSRMARITPAGFEKFYNLARLISTQVVSPANRDSEFPCTPADPKVADDTCAKQFYAKVGRLLYRRPLTTAELDEAVKAANEGAKTKGSFYAGAAVGLVGMLTSPQFLFIVDETEPDPDHAGQQRLTAYAKAARLSFLLWNSTPTDDLLTAAEKGELHKDSGLEKQVDRMMASSRLDSGVRAFFEDFLRFEQFDTLEKDATIYPAFSLKVTEDAREQVLRTMIDHLITRDADSRELFTTRKTFVTGPLARIYRIPVTRPSGNAWQPYEFPEGDLHAGILTQIGFAAVASHPGRSSPTLRGRAMRESLLCQKVPDPPGDVDFSKFEDSDSPNRTARERLTAHRSMEACAGCHKITDPMGLALENFDGSGAFRTTERGAQIDASGNLDGKSFTDVVGLGKALHDHPSLPTCLVERAYSYGSGGSANDQAKPMLAYLNQQFAAAGYRLPVLLRAIAMSNAFSDVKKPETRTASVSTPSQK